MEESGLQRSTPPIPMVRDADGIYRARVEGAGDGTRYWFKIDGAGPFPDPASRMQPLGVHGPSEVVRSDEFHWTDQGFRARALGELAIYELHVGTFTPKGTFLGIIEKLDTLRQLGVNVIELMPIADFAGDRNWGYDGVSLYAPARCYGTPDDLRQLIQAAHQRGLAVFLDVVYNHLGPDGAYHSTFAPRFYSGKHKTPWGDGLNFDGEARDKVRNYFIESALAWVYEYHIDGLRADATHAIQDDSSPHFLAELTERVHAAGHGLGRKIFVIAEDERNERKLILPREKNGYGFDAVWSDDFHHSIRHRLAGDSDGYYRDFDGTTGSIAKTIEQGWLFTGEFASHSGHGRGTSAAGLSHESRVFCIQNHDQIGNRAFGERLSTQISSAAYRAASALLLLSPELPLLFMGQEWAAPEPFLFFTQHNPELGRLVTEGRRKEFEHFGAFQDEANRERIPDPQAGETFEQSKLDWGLREGGDHILCWQWYQRLLHMRKDVLQHASFHTSCALDERAIELTWQSSSGNVCVVVALDGPCKVKNDSWRTMELALSSEDAKYALDPTEVSWNADTAELTLGRPGAVVLADARSAGWLGARS